MGGKKGLGVHEAHIQQERRLSHGGADDGRRVAETKLA